MANEDSVPELEKLLEDNFAEMKIGEDKFQQPEIVEQKISDVDKKIIYQERYSSENQTGTIHVKPISATKKTIETPIEVDEEEVDEIQIDLSDEVVKSVILDTPTSSIGDDFAVDW